MVSGGPRQQLTVSGAVSIVGWWRNIPSQTCQQPLVDKGWIDVEWIKQSVICSLDGMTPIGHDQISTKKTSQSLLKILQESQVLDHDRPHFFHEDVPRPVAPALLRFLFPTGFFSTIYLTGTVSKVDMTQFLKFTSLGVARIHRWRKKVLSWSCDLLFCEGKFWGTISADFNLCELPKSLRKKKESKLPVFIPPVFHRFIIESSPMEKDPGHINLASAV